MFEVAGLAGGIWFLSTLGRLFDFAMETCIFLPLSDRTLELTKLGLFCAWCYIYLIWFKARMLMESLGVFLSDLLPTKFSLLP
jgi:hypothetical protein